MIALLGLGMFGLLIIAPFIWTLSVSLRTNAQLAIDPFSWIPRPFTLEGYRGVLRLSYGLWVRNTLIIVVFSTIGQVISCSVVAYPLARMSFRGRDVVFLLVVATIMLPPQVLLIPQYLLFNALGWIDTFLPLTVPSYFGLTGIFVFLLRQFYRSIPVELEEAVLVDGGSPFAAFRHIIVPLSIPAFAVIAILQVVGSYNDFFLPLIYLQSSQLTTLALGIAQLEPTLLGGTTRFSIPMAAAGTILFAVPLVVFYALTHRSVTEAVEAGAGINR